MSQYTIKDVFRKGDHVVLTDEGSDILIKRYKRLKMNTGHVTGFSRKLSHCIMVRVEGTKKPRSFDASYWTRARAA
jgi:hypothetical protein